MSIRIAYNACTSTSTGQRNSATDLLRVCAHERVTEPDQNRRYVAQEPVRGNTVLRSLLGGK